MHINYNLLVKSVIKALDDYYAVKVAIANLKGEYIVKDIKDLVPYPWPVE